MDEQTTKDQPTNEEWTAPEERADDEAVGPDAEPVGSDNIREGRVRGTMHGGPSASQGQGQGG